MPPPNSKKIWLLVALLAVANLVAWLVLRGQLPTDHGRLIVFDVGQGDAIYFRSPQGNDILIDGGPSDAVLAKLGRAMPFADRTIELMILTHPHADHVAGLVEVLKRYRVKAVMFPDVPYDTSTYQAFLALVREKNIPVITPHLGQRVDFDQTSVFDVYYPLAAKFAVAPKDMNDASIVGKLSVGRTRALLTGDAGQSIEAELLNLHLPLRAAILKVGHHGSQHSSSQAFLDAVGAQFSAISVGQHNRYGHPAAATLTALANTPTQVLRTDEDGDLNFLLYSDRVVLQRN